MMEPVNNSPLRVGIAIVESQRRFLVGERKTTAHLGGMAEFPGGKCLPVESAEACVIRECLEETGLHVAVRELLLQEQFVYPDRSLDLSFFLCNPVSQQSQRLEEESFRWVPLEELTRLNFPAGNRNVLSILADRFSADEK